MQLTNDIPKDPNRHRERQRELISELDAVRKELEKEPAKKGTGLFGFFGKSNKDIAKKKDWETYKVEDDSAGNKDKTNTSSATPQGPSDDVLFDVDAIRAEIAQQAAEERNSPGKSGLSVPGAPANLRHAKSFDSAAAGPKISTDAPSLSRTASSHKHTPISPVKTSFSSSAKDAYYYSDDDEDEFGNKRNTTDDGEIQMTFGRWDEPPPTQSMIAQKGTPGYAGGTTFSTPPAVTSTIPQRTSSYAFYSAPSTNRTAVESVDLHPPQTDAVAEVTAGIGATSIVPETKNVWASDVYDYDDYDEDEFVEKEVTMSFA